jgi:hypothetical protein
MRSLPYNPDQGWLLPPRAEAVPGPENPCFCVRCVVDRSVRAPWYSTINQWNSQFDELLGGQHELA